ncbi:14575_t:CDS:2, partial [Gigaspora rosea]
ISYVKSKIPDDWTKDDYLNLGATLEPCIAHIKFGQITSEDFFQRVAVYKDAIDQDLYDELLKYHSGAAAKSKSTIPMSQRRGVDSVLIGENLDNSILSRSAGTISSICNSPLHGPVFRGILIFNGDFKDDCASYCNFDEATTPYEGPIRKTKDKFSVEELEVFQIIKKKL